MNKILFLALIPFSCIAQKKDTVKVKFVNTVQEIKTGAEKPNYFNIFAVKGEILFLKDDEPFPATKKDPKQFVMTWVKENKEFKEGEDYYLFNRGELSKAKADKLRDYLSLTEANGVLCSYSIREAEAPSRQTKEFHIVQHCSTPQGESITEIKELLMPPGGQIYECTNKHGGSPHSGPDKAKLTKDHGCETFRIKFNW